MILTLPPHELSSTRTPAEAFFKESGIDGVLNFDHFCQFWGKLIELDMAAIMLYVDEQKQPKGLIGGTCTACPMTGDLMGQESFWWIAPELRAKSPIGIKMLRVWENWAINKGAKRLYIGNLFTLNDGMRQLYLKLGYTPLEIHYVRKV